MPSLLAAFGYTLIASCLFLPIINLPKEKTGKEKKSTFTF